MRRWLSFWLMPLFYSARDENVVMKFFQNPL